MRPAISSVVVTPRAVNLSARSDEPRIIYYAGLVVVAVLLAYSNSFHGPFIFDDIESIQRNPQLRSFTSALNPPSDSGLANRPVAAFTFALNRAWSGERVISYHALNLLVHCLAALALFGVVRRVLLVSRFTPPIKAASAPLGACVALLWAVHPLQTESVTYLSQRTEALMGLFYLLVIYGFLRSLSSARPGRWQILSVVSALLGTGCKEVIATAPLIVLLCDRTFVVNTFYQAWRQRGKYYSTLFGATWIVLGLFMARAEHGNIGLGHGVGAWNYALTSCRSVVLYLGLSLWPRPLVFDYGLEIANGLREVWASILVLVPLVGLTLFAVWRRHPVGWAGAWFFGILAPASSIIPVLGQPTAEHRIYLSLAGVVAIGVIGLYRLVGRGIYYISTIFAVIFGGLTFARNCDYASELAIWQDTAAKRPDNYRAHNNVGNKLLDLPGRLTKAIAEFDAALRLKPDYADALINRGNALVQLPGNLEAAQADLELALRIKPNAPEAHNNLGNVFLKSPGQIDRAIAEYRKAVELNPEFPEAWINLADALAVQPDREDEAIDAYRQYLRLDPASWENHYKLGNLIAKTHAASEAAVGSYQTALRLNPNFAEAHFSLGSLLSDLPGELNDAIAHLETAVRLKPEMVDGHLNLGTVLAMVPGRMLDAVREFETALRLKPESADAHFNLGNALLSDPDRQAEAASHFQAAVLLRPDDADAHLALGQWLASQPGHVADSILHLEESVRLRPELTSAKELLAQLRLQP